MTTTADEDSNSAELATATPSIIGEVVASTEGTSTVEARLKYAQQPEVATEDSSPTVIEQQITYSYIESPTAVQNATSIPTSNEFDDDKCFGIWLFLLLLVGLWLVALQPLVGTGLVSWIVTVANITIASILSGFSDCCSTYNLSPKHQKLVNATLIVLCFELILSLYNSRFLLWIGFCTVTYLTIQ